MLCGLFTALYQLVLLVFYFFYFLFKGKPEWQKNGEQKCKRSEDNKRPVCCLHSDAILNNGDYKSADTSNLAGESITTQRRTNTTTSGETTTLHDTEQSSSSYKITVNFKGKTGCSHRTAKEHHHHEQQQQQQQQKQQAKSSTIITKISESSKYLITVPYEYTLTALTYTRDGIYSIFGSIGNLFTWQRLSKQSEEESIKKKLETEQKAFLEQVTEALEKCERESEARDILKTDRIEPEEEETELLADTTTAMVAGAPIFTDSFIEQERNTTFEAGQSEEFNDDSVEFYSRTEQRHMTKEESHFDTLLIPVPRPPPPSTEITPSATNLRLDSTVPRMKPIGAVAVLPADLMAEASDRIRELEQKMNEASEREQQKSVTESLEISTVQPPVQPSQQQANATDELHFDWAVSNRRLLRQPVAPPPPPTTTNDSQIPVLTHRNRAQERHGAQSRASETSDYDKDSSTWRVSSKQTLFSPQQQTKQTLDDDDGALVNVRGTKSPSFMSSSYHPESGFCMGRSVFSPMKEAEEMRPVINRHTSATPSEGIGGDNLGGSRVTTPFEDIIPQSRISTTFEANQQQQFGQQPTTYPQTRFADALFSPSRSRSQFRFAQNFSKIPIGQNYTYNRYSDNRDHQPTKRRSHTTEPRADNLVQSISRKWPPASNASGVEFTKDNWNVAPSTTTSCRKVMERTVTDKWITRDENGKVVEQKGERSWHGQTSGLHRRSDGTGESWHRVADLDPKGKSSFIDNRRLYTGDYVIESESRNL